LGRSVQAGSRSSGKALRVLLAPIGETGGVTILRRLLAYAEKIFGLSKALEDLTDNREAPRIPSSLVGRASVVMCLARLGSLNALEGAKEVAFWKRWLKASLPSPDSLGRICAGMDLAPIRDFNEHIYAKLKRNKALPPQWHGLVPLILDGHETHASYRRNCEGCLQRNVETAKGKRIQYFHRNVTAMIITEGLSFLVDSEPQIPGEDEVACALRLLERVLGHYPRAFDVVLGDALYSDPRLYNFVLDHGKDVSTVLKDDRRDLIQDARALFADRLPIEFSRGKASVSCWDLEGFTSWPTVNAPVRVVCSREVTKIRRQLDDKIEEVTSEWLWATTLTAARASSRAVVTLGHTRWDIENKGFNELATYWHADHVYKHDSTAILVFWLLCMNAVNLFHAFFRFNLKPAMRARTTMLMTGRLMLAELLGTPVEQKNPP
jgi:DDE family transposase